MSGRELVFVYGSLMSWVGIYRGGEPPLRVLASRPATAFHVRRGFGKWSGKNERWTMNLDRPPKAISVGRMEGGVQGLVLELADADLENLRKREGWPAELWKELKGFTVRSSVCRDLLRLLTSQELAGVSAIEQWKRLLRSPQNESSSWNDQLLPVPVSIEGGGACLVSWSPHSTRLLTIREAHSQVGVAVDPWKQFEYYAECTLGHLHDIDVTDFRDLTYEDEFRLRLETGIRSEKELIMRHGSLKSLWTPRARILLPAD